MLPRPHCALQNSAVYPLRGFLPHDRNGKGAEVPHARAGDRSPGPRPRRLHQDGVKPLAISVINIPCLSQASLSAEERFCYDPFGGEMVLERLTGLQAK